MKKLVIIGAGNQARVALEALRQDRDIDVIGMIADGKHEPRVGGLPVLGGINEFPDTAELYHIAIGDNSGRALVWSAIRVLTMARPHTVIHPSAVISPSAIILDGVYVGARAYVGPFAYVGNHTIVNTGSIIEHDCILGDFVHMAPGSVTGGYVSVGPGSFVGLGAVLRDRVKVGEMTTIGMGSVVVRDIASGLIAYGNPARVVTKHEIPPGQH